MDTSNDVDYQLFLTRTEQKLGMTILIGSIAAFFTILFKTIAKDTSNDSSVFILYFNIVIVLISIYSMKLYGILVAAISTALFNITLRKFDITSIDSHFIVNVIINVVQAFIIWLVIFNQELNKLNKTVKVFRDLSRVIKNNVLSAFRPKGINGISDDLSVRQLNNSPAQSSSSWLQEVFTSAEKTSDGFKLCLFIIGISYIIIGIRLLNKDSANQNDLLLLITISIVFSVFLYMLAGIIHKHNNGTYNALCSYIKYLVFICVIPGTICACINSIYSNYFNKNDPQDNFLLWITSNFILLSTFGYVFLSLFINNVKKEKSNISINLIPIKIPVILYYFSILLWNLLFFIMYCADWLDGDNTFTFAYFFPWSIGNILFISNFVLAQYNEFDINIIKETDTKHPFLWVEKRAIVTETNTAAIMETVVLAIPIFLTIFYNVFGREINKNIIVIFIFNVSVAVASIALIWVPQGNIRFMSLLKTIKTILHLFSISLLLLISIMFINELAKKKVKPMNNYMQVAIDEARQGMFEKHGGPFGAVVVKNGVVAGRGHNRVLFDSDPTQHGEIVAIRDAYIKSNSQIEKGIIFRPLKDATLYTTCYPCPMCLSACLWSGISKIYYGCTSDDAALIGFDDAAFYEYFTLNKKAFKLLEQDKDNYKSCLKLFNDYKGIMY